MSEASIQLLCSSMLQSKSVTELDLQSCGVTSSGACLLAALLSKQYKLKALYLSHNNIEDDGTRELLQGV